MSKLEATLFISLQVIFLTIFMQLLGRDCQHAEIRPESQGSTEQGTQLPPFERACCRMTAYSSGVYRPDSDCPNIFCIEVEDVDITVTLYDPLNIETFLRLRQTT